MGPGGAALSPAGEGVVLFLGAPQPLLCLLIVLLIPCVVLLFLLDCLLLLRCLAPWQRGSRRRQLGDQSLPAQAVSAPSNPPQVTPSSPIACHGPGPAVGLRGCTPCSEEGLAGGSWRLPCCSGGAALPCNSRRPPRNLPPCCSQAQQRAPPWIGASQETVSSSDRDARPPPVPPNTPPRPRALGQVTTGEQRLHSLAPVSAATPLPGATSQGAAWTLSPFHPQWGIQPVLGAAVPSLPHLSGHPKGDIPPETHQHPENGSHHPPPLPHSCGLGAFRVRAGDGETAPLNSANFTTSLGPGLDSDFGASAGISLRVVSSASEEGAGMAGGCPQASGGLEWDYGDPSYKGRPARLCRPPKLPLTCSKQYWL